LNRCEVKHGDTPEFVTIVVLVACCWREAIEIVRIEPAIALASKAGGLSTYSPWGGAYGKIADTEHLAGHRIWEGIMSNEQRDPLDQSEPSRLLADLKEQCARLQQVVQQLEEEKNRDAEQLAAARAELKEYERIMLNLMAQKFPEDNWSDFKEEDYTLAAEDVIAELERQEGS
jgi:hypothetical protein